MSVLFGLVLEFLREGRLLKENLGYSDFSSPYLRHSGQDQE